MVIGPITQAVYPRLCELHARAESRMMAATFHEAAQLVSVIAGSVAIVIILYPEVLLRLWTQDPELAARAAPLLSLLMLGNLLNGLMWVPYQAQLAHGWTSLSVRINIVAVLVIVPAILWATPRYGAEGAAWIWVSLNTGYVLLGVHFMYRKILRTEKWRWYLRDVLAPLSGALIAVLSVNLLWPFEPSSLSDFSLLALSGVASAFAAFFAAVDVRKLGIETIKSHWKI
jgi:O-antigen/teichoic acid export membrane protein